MPGMHCLDVNADAHILVDDWLPMMLRVINEKDIGVASGKRPDLFYDDGRYQYYRDCFTVINRGGEAVEWDKVNNSIIFPWAMMKSDLIEEIGYMNEKTCIDDINYCVRVAAVGKKCVYIPNVVILQPHGEEPQNHPEYKANREMVMMHWSEHIATSTIETVTVGCGSRFIPGSITDPVYQRASDANYNFFKNYKRTHGLE
jgi:GT2 family glycosyltransferase